jgi:uncharacterized protein (DUF362 family)
MASKQDQDFSHGPSLPRRMSRRRFLEIAGAVATGFVIASCTPNVPSAPGQPTAVDVAPTAVPPTATQAVVEQVAPTTAAVGTPPAATGTASKVAIGKAGTYDRKVIYNAVRDMLDDLGGLGDVVRSGDRVGIKTNLTSGTSTVNPLGLAPTDTFVTHPEVVRALVELVRDAGAREIYIVEAVYEWESYTEWGYDEVARDTGAILIDLNDTKPYNEFVNVSVPGGGSGLYDTYIFNPLLTEFDAFMSVAKMKCHWTAGVTHSLKNHFGLIPARFYRLSEDHNHRSELHGPTDETAGQRVPRIIVDLNQILPIDLALIDGVKTTEGGEGPWIRATYGPIAPGVLFAGKDPVATDAIATVAQGFDPTIPGMKQPFIRGLNHLKLAADAGLGSNRPSEIATLGADLTEVTVPFRTAG